MLNALDWTVIAVALAVAFLPAVLLTRRASRGSSEFFAAGRAAPWWLIGTSMVATTFSTDTPNLVTDFVRTGGVSRNWLWWAFLVTGMMTTFFYARLWRRSGVLTDLEFYELRYSGTPAAFVRGFRALYLGLFFNCMIMATVTLAAVKIAGIMLGWPAIQTVAVCGGICIVFSVLSGLWGVLAADVIQFVIAMVGVFAAAYYALDHPSVGGLHGMVEKLDPATLSLLPDFSSTETALAIFIIPLAVQWWSVWYPGAEPGGGSYVAQRMLAAKDEQNAMGATLWFNIAHYALRPWPWIIVALCSLLVYPTLDDLRTAFPHVEPGLIGDDIAYPAMLTLLPHGLLGLLLASLLSAYVSTMSTHLNWGASYLVHDFFRRFIRPQATEKHTVFVSRLVTAGLMLAAGGLVFLLDTAQDAFTILLSVGAGTGLIYLLRWFWWRINAWSEIAAMIASFLFAVTLLVMRKTGVELPEHLTLIASVAATSLTWIVVTLLTAPSDDQTLTRFYTHVRPAGPGWRHIRELAGVGPSPDSLPHAFLGWGVGCACVYAALFGTGSLLYGHVLRGVVGIAVFLVCLGGLLWIMRTVSRHGTPATTTP